MTNGRDQVFFPASGGWHKRERIYPKQRTGYYRHVQGTNPFSVDFTVPSGSEEVTIGLMNCYSPDGRMYFQGNRGISNRAGQHSGFAEGVGSRIGYSNESDGWWCESRVPSTQIGTEADVTRQLGAAQQIVSGVNFARYASYVQALTDAEFETLLDSLKTIQDLDKFGDANFRIMDALTANPVTFIFWRIVRTTILNVIVDLLNRNTVHVGAIVSGIAHLRKFQQTASGDYWSIKYRNTLRLGNANYVGFGAGTAFFPGGLSTISLTTTQRINAGIVNVYCDKPLTYNLFIPGFDPPVAEHQPISSSQLTTAWKSFTNKSEIEIDLPAGENRWVSLETADIVLTPHSDTTRHLWTEEFQLDIAGDGDTTFPVVQYLKFGDRASTDGNITRNTAIIDEDDDSRWRYRGIGPEGRATKGIFRITNGWTGTGQIRLHYSNRLPRKPLTDPLPANINSVGATVNNVQFVDIETIPSNVNWFRVSGSLIVSVAEDDISSVVAIFGYTTPDGTNLSKTYALGRNETFRFGGQVGYDFRGVTLDKSEGVWEDWNGPVGTMRAVTIRINTATVSSLTYSVEYSTEGIYPTGNTGIVAFPSGNRINVSDIPSWATRIKLEFAEAQANIDNGQQINYRIAGATTLTLELGSSTTNYTSPMVIGRATLGSQLAIDQLDHVFFYKSTTNNTWYTNPARDENAIVFNAVVDRLRVTLTNNKTYTTGVFRVTWYNYD